MAKAHSKLKLDVELFDAEFMDPSKAKQDARKVFRAERKRRLREAELRMRRQHSMRKSLGGK